MSTDSGALIDLDLRAAKELIDRNIKILGEDWLSRRLKKDDEERQVAQNSNHQKRRIRHQARHPVAQWYLEYLNLLSSPNAEHLAVCSQSLLLLASLCSNLEKAANCVGMEHVLERMRKPDEFFAAAFEVEVAVGYLNKGWKVAFVETGKNRSPDLEVIQADGSMFWAECKYKEEMTERDLANEAYCGALKDKLYKVWGPTKQNFGLKIEFACDPDISGLNDVYEVVLEMGSQLAANGSGTKSAVSASMISGKHRIILHSLLGPDESAPYQVIDYGGDSTEFLAEKMQTVHFGPLMKNPKVFDFKYDDPPDKYRSVVNSFNSAVGQIPESGPGVIWIRIPFPVGYTRIAQDLNSMMSKIRGELTGEYNRRVNAVVLSSRWFSDEPNTGVAANSYRHACRILEHTQPRVAL